MVLRNRTLDEAPNRAALVERFARYGVAADRLTLEGGAEHFDFLRGYDQVDVALDTFPYNGGTTTAEALWQGVPVLTCNGDRWAGRTSRSLLLAGGLDEWVAADLAGFHAAAVGLAQAADTPGRLAALRGGLRARLLESAACDVAGLCRALEALYTSPAGAGEVTKC
jgi:predicted O-linked N-acetylglucosamine transferase (SPINDLY family)